MIQRYEAETPGMTVEELGCLLNTESATAAWATCAGSQDRKGCVHGAQGKISTISVFFPEKGVISSWK